MFSHFNKTKDITLNGAILVECKTLRNVVSLVAEEEVSGVYYNATQAIVIQRGLQALGHLQPSTPKNTILQLTIGYKKQIHP